MACLIYLKEGKTPLNLAFNDEIVHEGNGKYQLTFKFPTNNSTWELLTEETLLLADDLHGEQEFIIFEIVKNHGYVTVYANQVATLLNHYSITSLSVTNANGYSVMNALASSIIRNHTFNFYSDIVRTHSINLKNTTVANALFKGKQSILGQWGGDLIRDKYSIGLLENGGSTKEVLFMYKKNLKSYQQKKSIKDLRTRIHFTKTIPAKNENEKDRVIAVTVDSPLINKYKNIYEDSLEATTQDVIDEASLRKYGENYFRTTLCDVLEESIEIDVVGNPEEKIGIFDTVTIFHEKFNLDVKKKITKYTYSPIGQKLKTIGFGVIQNTLGGSLGAMVSNAVDSKYSEIIEDFDKEVKKRMQNADRAFDSRFQKMKESIEDSIEKSKALSEEEKAKLAAEISSKLTASKIDTDKIKADFDKWLKEPLKELQDEIDKNAQLSRINNELIGGDGITRYNKNRLAGDPNRTIELGTDYIEVGHNGSGFEVGQQYTISWSAECTPYGHRDVTTLLRTPYLLTGGTVVYTPQDNRFPTIQQNFTTDRAVVPMVYFGLYNVRYESNWYKTKTIVKNINEMQEDVTLQLEWKEIFDGNQGDSVLLGWSDRPDLIIDGGVG